MWATKQHGGHDVASPLVAQIVRRASSSSSRLPSIDYQLVINKPLLPLWIVNNKAVKRALPYIGNGAYTLIASGFLCTDIVALRCLLVAGYGGLVAYHALQQRPLRIPLKWSFFFVTVNVFMVGRLLYARLPIALSEDEEALHVASFAPLSRKQFKRLLDIGERRTFPEGTALTEEGVARTELMFLVRGSAVMSVKGKVTSHITAGAFPNCLAFQRAGWQDTTASTANHKDLFWPTAHHTIRTTDEVEAIVWRKDELLSVLESDPEMRQRMDHVIVEAIMRRLLSSPNDNAKDYLRVISQGWADTSVRKRKLKLMESGSRVPLGSDS